PTFAGETAGLPFISSLRSHSSHSLEVYAPFCFRAKARSCRILLIYNGCSQEDCPFELSYRGFSRKFPIGGREMAVSSRFSSFPVFPSTCSTRSASASPFPGNVRQHLNQDLVLSQCDSTRAGYPIHTLDVSNVKQITVGSTGAIRQSYVGVLQISRW
ncbi:hypothetical protein EDD18DRAFT_1208535, partial [Armillaria luteobubalina]